MKYNYVYFNTNYSRHGQLDKYEYNSICLRDLEGKDYARLIQMPLDHCNIFIRRAFNLALKIARKTSLRFDKLFYPFLFKNDFCDDKPLCFVISSYILPLDYFTYLRKRYHSCKIVKVYRDLVSVIEKSNSEYSLENVKNTFDCIFSYDKGEAERFGLVYFDEIESKIELPDLMKYPKSDVFFAAKAKDRLPKIVKAYDILAQKGYDCYFYITGVPLEKRVERSGIFYADSNMPYIEMLCRSVNSKCMLDINQGGSIGYTSRFIESILYNKKIIIDNPMVLNSKFFNPNYIQYVSAIEDINPDFVNDGVEPKYKYNGEFSPLTLIRLIDMNISEI